MSEANGKMDKGLRYIISHRPEEKIPTAVQPTKVERPRVIHIGKQEPVRIIRYPYGR